MSFAFWIWLIVYPIAVLVIAIEMERERRQSTAAVDREATLRPALDGLVAGLVWPVLLAGGLFVLVLMGLMQLVRRLA